MKSGAIIILAGVILFSQPLLAAGEGWNLSTGGANSNVNNGGQGDTDNGRQGYRNDRQDDDQQQRYDTGNNNSSTNTDVVVDIPPEAWTQRQNNQPPCLSCCTYQNHSYTEGSVVKMEGVLLQCVRDEKSFGTNNLIWRTVK